MKKRWLIGGPKDGEEAPGWAKEEFIVENQNGDRVAYVMKEVVLKGERRTVFLIGPASFEEVAARIQELDASE